MLDSLEEILKIKCFNVNMVLKKSGKKMDVLVGTFSYSLHLWDVSSQLFVFIATYAPKLITAKKNKKIRIDNRSPFYWRHCVAHMSY